MGTQVAGTLTAAVGEIAGVWLLISWWDRKRRSSRLLSSRLRIIAVYLLASFAPFALLVLALTPGPGVSAYGAGLVLLHFPLAAAAWLAAQLQQWTEVCDAARRDRSLGLEIRSRRPAPVGLVVSLDLVLLLAGSVVAGITWGMVRAATVSPEEAGRSSVTAMLLLLAVGVPLVALHIVDHLDRGRLHAHDVAAAASTATGNAAPQAPRTYVRGFGRRMRQEWADSVLDVGAPAGVRGPGLVLALCLPIAGVFLAGDLVRQASASGPFAHVPGAGAVLASASLTGLLLAVLAYGPQAAGLARTLWWAIGPRRTHHLASPSADAASVHGDREVE